MALYHFHVGRIGRAGGQSAIASAAYRAGEELYSEYYGEKSDYTHKGGVLYTEVMLPPNAPPKYQDRQTLWNAVEEVEKHKKAQLAYSFDIALQNEFSPEENIALAKRFVQEYLVSKGMIADLAVHEPDKKGEGIQNPHFHVMTTMRPLNPDGSWGSKQRREYVLDENGNRQKDENGNYVFNAVHTTDWHTPETLHKWREDWCNMVNEAFERKGLNVRIDHRSFEEKGIDQIPTIHEGPQIRKMEAQGILTDKGDKNRWIRATNRLIASLKKKIRSILDWIAEQKTRLENAIDPKPVTPVNWIRQYYAGKRRGTEGSHRETDQAEIDSCISLLEENSIQTMDDLETFTQNLFNQADDIATRSREVASQIRELDSRIQLAETIETTQPVIEQMNAIHWKKPREKFQTQHQNEIDRYYSTKRILKEKYGTSRPSLPAWKQKKSQLLKQKAALEEQHAPLKEKVDQLIMIKHQISEAQRIDSRNRDRQQEKERFKAHAQQER